MESLKTYLWLFLTMLSCFNLGLYASSTFRYNEPIELHRWIITGLFGIVFLGFFLIDYRKMEGKI